MATARLRYLGNLRTESTHVQSGNVVVTDAPVDNHGKGEAFSPTDLLSASLAACMVTIIGIAANSHGIELGEVEAETTKTMVSDPRRVGKIEISLRFLNGGAFDDKTRKIIERSALTCPVYLSLHPDLEKVVHFLWK